MIIPGTSGTLARTPPFPTPPFPTPPFPTSPFPTSPFPTSPLPTSPFAAGPGGVGDQTGFPASLPAVRLPAAGRPDFEPPTSDMRRAQIWLIERQIGPIV